MICIEVDNFIEKFDKPHTFLTVVDKTSVHRQAHYGVAICVRSFEFTTGALTSWTLLINIRYRPLARIDHGQKFEDNRSRHSPVIAQIKTVDKKKITHKT